MSLICFNARSIVNKIDKLEQLLILYSPGVVVITETWLHSGIHDSEIIPSCYSFVRFDRDGRGGGVAIAVKRGLTYHAEQGIHNHESVWCTIKGHDTFILIGAIYRKPNAPDEYLTRIHDYLTEHVKNRSKVVLIGDFNLPSIDWNTLSITGKEASSCELLLNIGYSFSLDQLVMQPTRIKEQTSSVLDLAFVSHTCCI